MHADVDTWLRELHDDYVGKLNADTIGDKLPLLTDLQKLLLALARSSLGAVNPDFTDEQKRTELRITETLVSILLRGLDDGTS